MLSCKIYTATVIDKKLPGEVNPYPIKDTTTCAVKIKMLDGGQTYWCRDMSTRMEYVVGDTISFFIKKEKNKQVSIK